MDIMASLSEDSLSPSQCVYQQNQVIWAKIRGYPWWPAYIGAIEEDNQNETLYTVYFFGDQTQYSISRINVQKMRKFQAYFSIFSQNAKRNYKLKQSLLSAQQQLKQNNQDISYFDLGSPQKRGRKPSKGINRQRSNNQSQNTSFSDKSQRGVRKRGRPRKVQSIQVDKITEKDENYGINNKATKLPFKLELKEQKDNENSEEKSQKDDDLFKLKELMNRGLYKQAIRYLNSLTINNLNVIGILQTKIMETMTDKVTWKQLRKLQQILKKALIHKYFSFDFKNNFDFHSLKYSSIRGQTVRRLLKLLKRMVKEARQTQNDSMRTIALEWQCAIRDRYRQVQGYMKQMMQLFGEIQESRFTLDQLKQKITKKSAQMIES